MLFFETRGISQNLLGFFNDAGLLLAVLTIFFELAMDFYNFC